MIKFNTQDVIHIALSKKGFVIVESVPEKGVCFSFRPITNREYARYFEAFYSVKSAKLVSKQKKLIEDQIDLNYMGQLDQSTTEWQELKVKLDEIVNSEKFLKLDEEIQELSIQRIEKIIDVMPKFLVGTSGKLSFTELSPKDILDISDIYYSECLTVSEDDQLFFD